MCKEKRIYEYTLNILVICENFNNALAFVHVFFEEKKYEKN